MEQQKEDKKEVIRDPIVKIMFDDMHRILRAPDQPVLFYYLFVTHKSIEGPPQYYRSYFSVRLNTEDYTKQELDFIDSLLRNPDEGNLLIVEGIIKTRENE